MKILVITDMGIKGSGYQNISSSLFKGLAEQGHEIKVIGFEYRGEEHWFPFSILPCHDFNQAQVMINNLSYMWEFDIMFVALDITHQRNLLKVRDAIQQKNPDHRFKYWGLMPLESTPLAPSSQWELMKMDKVFIISEFGTEECLKNNINATYFPVGVDTESWRLPTEKERDMLRGSYGLDDDTFVILTVADNQERKFLSRAAQIVQKFRDTVHDKVMWFLITRPNLPVGWNLPDLMAATNLTTNHMIIPRGVKFKELWGYYALSDVFLLTSKAEGLGMPVLEAFACGVPVVGTDTTGIRENVRKGGGFLIDPEKMSAQHIDPFENTHRWFADLDSGVNQLRNVFEGNGTDTQVSKARGYVETLTWETAVLVVNNELEKEENG